MRQVFVFEQRQVSDDTYGGYRVMKVEKARGFFHRWATYLGQTAAVVELEDGTVEYVSPDMVKFYDPFIFRIAGQVAIPASDSKVAA